MMKTQYEQRVLETKKKIFSAFIQMMQRMPIHQISISELCHLAGINRSTFYNHFGSPYDVLTAMTGDFLEGMEETLQNVSPDDQEGVQRRVELCFEYAVQHRETALLLMQNSAGTDFATRLFSMPKIENLLNKKFSDMQDEIERKACISFVTHGSYQLLLEWLKDPDRISPGQEAALILNLARKIC